MALTDRDAIPRLQGNPPVAGKDFVNPRSPDDANRRLPFGSAAFDTCGIEPLLRTRDDVGAGIRVGWELLHLLQLSVRSLEDTATRAVAGQVAGLIALWTQFYTFEEDVPKGLAWVAWLLLLASISILAVRITPRRLFAFWQQLDLSRAISADPLDEADEARIVEELTNALRSQRDRLQRAVRLSVALAICGLGIVALAYVVDKGFYSP